MYIVIVNGLAKTGKDLFVSYCYEYLKEKHIYSDRYSTIIPVKEAMKFYFGWDGITKDDKSRTFMSEIKDAWIKFNNGPFNYIKDIYTQTSLTRDQFVLFVDSREIEELQKFKDEYKEKCITVLIERTTTNEPKELQNKWKLDRFKYDVSIKNNATKDVLQQRAIKFCKQLTF